MHVFVYMTNGIILFDLSNCNVLQSCIHHGKHGTKCKIFKPVICDHYNYEVLLSFTRVVTGPVEEVLEF